MPEMKRFPLILLWAGTLAGITPSYCVISDTADPAVHEMGLIHQALDPEPATPGSQQRGLARPAIENGIARSALRFQVVASTDDQDLQGRNIQFIDRRISANDTGWVAFMGKTRGADGVIRPNIFSVNPNSGAIRAVLNTSPDFELKELGTYPAPSQTFGPPFINENNEIFAWRYMSARVQIGFPFGEFADIPLTYLEAWSPSGNLAPNRRDMPLYQVASAHGGAGSIASLLFFIAPISGATLPTPFNRSSPWDAIHGRRDGSFPAVNESGKAAFCTLLGNANYVASSGTTGPQSSLRLGGTLPRLRIANTSEILGNVQAAGSSSLRIMEYANTTRYRELAATSKGWVSLGPLPAMSPDAQSVVFTGVTDESGARDLGITPGPGVFLAARLPDKNYKIHRLCGQTQNGFLDPGEVWVDSDSNGLFGPKEDVGSIGNITLSAEASVSNSAMIAYEALDLDGRKAIFLQAITDQVVGVPIRIVSVGEALEGFGSITDLAVSDSVSSGSLPDLVFWASSGEKSGIIRASLCGSPSCVESMAGTGAAKAADMCRAYPNKASGYGWSMELEYGNNGVELVGVKLGDRLMANRISLPYFTFQTSRMRSLGLPVARGELKVASNADDPLGSFLLAPPAVRLVTDDRSTRLEIDATFVVGGLPGDSKSCLEVTQHFEFLDLPSSLPFEPSGQLMAQRFGCHVKYRFKGKDDESLLWIEFAQRFHLQPDGREHCSAAFVRDNDLAVQDVLQTIGRAGALTFVYPSEDENPLKRELLVNGVVDGKAGMVDNVHVTFVDRLQKPIVKVDLLAGLGGSDLKEFVRLGGFSPHGASEAVHFHWRWAPLADYVASDRWTPTRGIPLWTRPPLGDGLDQDLDIAIARFRPGEEDPEDARGLIGGEDLADGTKVVWFFGRAKREVDSVFPFSGAFEGQVHYLPVERFNEADGLNAVVTRGGSLDKGSLLAELGGQLAGIQSVVVRVQSLSDFSLVSGPVDVELPLGYGVTPRTPPDGISPSGRPYFRVSGFGRDGVLHPSEGSLYSGETSVGYRAFSFLSRFGGGDSELRVFIEGLRLFRATRSASSDPLCIIPAPR